MTAQLVHRSVVAGLIITLGFLALAGPAAAVLSGRNGRIAFTSGREAPNDNNAQVWLRGASGSSGFGTLSGPVTPFGGQSRHPSFSPDRTKMVFANGTFTGNPATEEYDLFVKDLVDGGVAPLDGTQLGDGLSSDHPAWSPDGTRIAYETQTVDNDANREIKVKTFGTAAPAATLTATAQMELKPAWSPDSQTLFYARQNGTQQASNYDIVREPSDGTGAETPVANQAAADEYQPSISPDGKQICFTLQTTAGNPGSADIYTRPVDSPTPMANLSLDPNRGDINCTWSPDGKRIAYSSGVFGQGRLVMRAADGSETDFHLLEDDKDSNNFDGNADWAPDGSPDCPDTTVTTRPDTSVTIQLECTDTGPLYERTDPNGTVTTPPTNGTLSDDSPLTNPSTVKYTPKAGFTGTDTLTYLAFDSFGFGTDTGTVTINVTAPDTGGGNPGDGGGATDGDLFGDLSGLIGDVGGDNTGGGGGQTPPSATCAGVPATIVGTDGADVIKGTRGRDVIVAGGGADRISAAGGRDVVCAGNGDDKVSGGAGSDRLLGQAGRDKLVGGAGNDRVSGGAGNDRLSGGAGNDRLAGDKGVDRVAGGGGRDNCGRGAARERTVCERVAR